MVYADYQSNTPRAVQLADKLITQDKVDYICSRRSARAPPRP
jgi:branched-chain amino acid transport system substrate-binding protein